MQIGSILENRYRIDRLISKEGGFGTVYEAHAIKLKKTVALKQTKTKDKACLQALTREARMLANLSHPSLPRVFDHFELPDEGYFLVMEFIPGQDLSEALEQNRDLFPVEKVLAWADQLLEVLELLHQRMPPVVHCDIKPANLKPNGEGRIMLLDFGLASGLPPELASSIKTVAGKTPAYASYEQLLDAGQPDPSFDVYSAGATIYHLLTGFLPVSAGKRGMSIMVNNSDPLVPAHKKDQRVPIPVSEVVGRALAFKAEDRPTVQEFRRQLRDATEGKSPFPPTFTNSIGMEFVLIPVGKFWMGSTEEEVEAVFADRKRYNADAKRGWFEGEMPRHEVTFGKPFYFGKYQVMQGEWKAVMGNNPSYFKRDDRLPVESVSWDDCQEFLRKLNERRDGYEYRLPSEAEWEYACRAGTTTAFSCGDTIITDQVNYDGDYPYGSAPKGVSRQKTTPVGSFPPNAWGLHDMHGNVWEWCQDRYHESYEGAPNDGSAWESGSDNRRVLRGGGWDSNASSCRSALRDWGTPDYRSFNFSFRVIAARTK